LSSILLFFDGGLELGEEPVCELMEPAGEDGDLIKVGKRFISLVRYTKKMFNKQSETNVA
jgi:hypothetical protein